MSPSDQTIFFSASRKKLMRYVFGLVFGVLMVSILFATVLYTLATNPNHAKSNAAFLIRAILVTAMWLYIVYETFRAAMRASHPDTIEISTQKIRVSDWRKSATYQWSDLGVPEKIMRVRGGHVTFTIKIPFLHQETKPIAIETVMYADGYEEIFAALLAARSGTLKYSWGIDQTPRYRNPETATDRLVGKLALSFVAILIAIAYIKVFTR